MVSYLLLLTACRGGDDPDTKVTGDGVPVPGLVPLPALVEPGEVSYTLGEGDGIAWSGGGEAEAELLAEALRPATGFELRVHEGASDAIRLRLDTEAGLASEAYTLDVGEDGVDIVASDLAGLYYGTQTLRQLLPTAVFYESEFGGPWVIPAVHVEDAPAWPWRGFMLDVARHFFDVDEVERQVDLMGQHKLNRLHLHLTDDQGWRIEIQSWPLLTEIGGSTEVGGGEGGWYTQEAYAGIVAYASARHVTVVPEVDFPGHAHAALASYAELNEDGTAEDLYTGTGVISTSLWLESETTWEFVQDVWGELAAITPGPWVHLGADEAVNTDDEDYAVFVPWLMDEVRAAGKTPVGWDEIGDIELDPPFLVQHWWSADRAVTAAAQGGQLVASPAEHTYLDMVHDGDAEFGQVWAGPLGVEDAYDWDPVPGGMDSSGVAGVEAALWTELIDSHTKLEFMVWPRLCATAEVGWTAGEQREWREFRGRLGEHGRRLRAQGVGFYESPEVEWE